MKLTKCLAFLLILILIVGCNEYEKVMEPAVKAKLSDQNLNPIFDGFPEPAIPDREENDKTLLGIDSDNNGIRDDIDIWINRTGKNYNERMVLRQLARVYVTQMLAGKDKNYKAMQSAKIQEAEVGMECMPFIFRPYYPYKYVQNLNEMLIILYENTDNRKKSLNEIYNYNHSYGHGGEKKEYEFCKFSIENFNKVKSDYDKFINEDK